MSTGANFGGLGRRSEMDSANDPKRRVTRFLLHTFLAVAIIIVLTVIGVAWYSTTPAFENRVRGILISTLEDSVG